MLDGYLGVMGYLGNKSRLIKLFHSLSIAPGHTRKQRRDLKQRITRIPCHLYQQVPPVSQRQ